MENVSDNFSSCGIDKTDDGAELSYNVDASCTDDTKLVVSSVKIVCFAVGDKDSINDVPVSEVEVKVEDNGDDKKCVFSTSSLCGVDQIEERGISVSLSPFNDTVGNADVTFFAELASIPDIDTRENADALSVSSFECKDVDALSDSN